MSENEAINSAIAESLDSSNFEVNYSGPVQVNGNSYFEESTLKYDIPRNFQFDFSEVDTSKADDPREEVVNALASGKFYDNQRELVSGDSFSGTDKNGVPITVVVYLKDNRGSGHGFSINVPQNLQKRPTSFNVDAAVLIQGSGGGSNLDLRSDDDSVKFEEKEDEKQPPDDEGNYPTYVDAKATTIQVVDTNLGLVDNIDHKDLTLSSSNNSVNLNASINSETTALLNLKAVTVNNYGGDVDVTIQPAEDSPVRVTTKSLSDTSKRIELDVPLLRNVKLRSFYTCNNGEVSSVNFLISEE
jgi:hypothetical protein